MVPRPAAQAQSGSNAAVRAANEIAWMHDETAAMLAFGRDVAAATPDDYLAAALAAVAPTPATLHLADVAQWY